MAGACLIFGGAGATQARIGIAAKYAGAGPITVRRCSTTMLADTGAATTGGTGAASAKARTRRQANALAELTVAEAGERLVLDWSKPLRHAAFYKAVYRPAVLRANTLTPTAKLDADQSFHSLRHTYASLCVAALIPPAAIAELMCHRDVKTTLTVYAHLINIDDHAGNMAALGALAAPKPTYTGNVVPLVG
jgi:integrase